MSPSLPPGHGCQTDLKTSICQMPPKNIERIGQMTVGLHPTVRSRKPHHQSCRRIRWYNRGPENFYVVWLMDGWNYRTTMFHLANGQAVLATFLAEPNVHQIRALCKSRICKNNRGTICFKYILLSLSINRVIFNLPLSPRKKRRKHKKSLTWQVQNIARGTTDPAYWVHNVSKSFS